MSIETWSLFVLTGIVATFVPGPAMLLCLTHGVQHGVSRTFSTAVGIATASGLQASVAALGLGAVLATSATLFSVIKICGAAYLVYLGVRLFLADDICVESGDGECAQSRRRGLYKQGLLVGLSNPKAVVFFTSLFPQFLSPGDSFAHCAALVVCLLSISILSSMVYAAGGRAIRAFFRRNRVRKYFNKGVGGFFVASGVGLAASES